MYAPEIEINPAAVKFKLPDVDSIVLDEPVTLISPDFTCDILPSASVMIADETDATPCVPESISVKYLPPITSTFAAEPATSVPVPI